MWFFFVGCCGLGVWWGGRRGKRDLLVSIVCTMTWGCYEWIIISCLCTYVKWVITLKNSNPLDIYLTGVCHTRASIRQSSTKHFVLSEEVYVAVLFICDLSLNRPLKCNLLASLLTLLSRDLYNQTSYSVQRLNWRCPRELLIRI